MSFYKPVYALLWVSLLFVGACRPPQNTETSEEWEEIPITFAQGFSIKRKQGVTLVEINEAFPKAHRTYRYVVFDEEEIPETSQEFDAVISLPVSKIVLTSTTHIPHLDMLGRPDLLAGFPNLDLISSERIRSRIQAGEITDLGAAALPNTEQTLDLSPDWVMFSTLGNDLSQLDVYKNAGIPAILNGDYLENHPLGMAEWIKVTGALIGKLDEAINQFEEVVSAYQDTEQLIRTHAPDQKPTVMTGVMYQDVWYAPGGESWGSILLEAAGGHYLFGRETGKGGLSLNYEYVLDNAMDADLWIGAADYTGLSALALSDKRYTAFRPFQEANVFTYTNKKGEKGGLLYFELGYARPDLVLKDLIKIIHPQLLPDHPLYFYQKLE